MDNYLTSFKKLDWKPLEIDDLFLFQKAFNRHFSLGGQPFSEFSFITLYLWQFTYPVRHARLDNYLLIEINVRDTGTLVFPPFELEESGTTIQTPLETLMADYRARNLPFELTSLGTYHMELIEKTMPGFFHFEPLRDRFDYVYLVSDLIKLKGLKYRSKRNHIHHFEANYGNDFTYERINSGNLDKVIDAIEDWCRIRSCAGNPDLEGEKKGIYAIVNNFEKFTSNTSLKGAILSVSGKPVAFTFGEQLTSDTVVIHVEKANPAIHGAYQFINRIFLEKEWKHLKYVNREEDAGVEGLRTAKLSYHPLFLLEKYSGIPLSRHSNNLNSKKNQ